MESFVRDVGGAVYVEYLILLSVVSLAGATALVGLGLPLLRLFRYAETLIALPIP
ncbi:MAG TPA: hypothetical protein VNO33_01500 [Kofleriaceae bacterium]|nr:hypothetical protein [Kofleriaceae bacterium]